MRRDYYDPEFWTPEAAAFHLEWSTREREKQRRCRLERLQLTARRIARTWALKKGLITVDEALRQPGGRPS